MDTKTRYSLWLAVLPFVGVVASQPLFGQATYWMSDSSQTAPVAAYNNMEAESVVESGDEMSAVAPMMKDGSWDGCNCNACRPSGGLEFNPLLRGFGLNLAGRLCGAGCCNSSCYEGALGHEALPYAPFFVRRAKPLNNFQFQFLAAYDQEFPDRSEVFWARSPGSGPQWRRSRRDVGRLPRYPFPHGNWW